MLILLSPAKNLNFNDTPAAPPASVPRMLADARELAATAAKLSPSKLRKLMDLSDKLASLNHQRFKTFAGSPDAAGSKPAALAFNGDVYHGLNAATMTPDDFDFAQGCLRILSGLYGVLRPLDAIEPYRLEMGAVLKNSRGKDLYAFWSDRIAKMLNEDAADHKDATLVNLASAEYFGAVDPAVLQGPVVTPSFKEEKEGALRSLQFFAKRARGRMARWIVEHRVERASDLKHFDCDGYRLDESRSDGGEMVFTRKQPKKKAA
jgi:cytoplasmic iron level regulating protein YaaA (DUF328/UPF0246 family)